MTDVKAKRLRAAIEKGATSLDDATALTAVELYPVWVSGQAYDVDVRVQHNGTLYRCVQAHTSQDDWTPDATPALWTAVSLDEWPEFVQPTGAQDAYQTGDKVTYNGKHYISLADNNVWSPDAYPDFWKVV